MRILHWSGPLTMALLIAAPNLLLADGESAPSQESPAAAPIPSASQLREWAAELGSASFRQRQRAYRQLQQADRLALPALCEAAHNEDMETRWRALSLLVELCISRQAGQPQAVERSLAELAADPRPAVAFAAKAALRQCRAAKTAIATEQIERFGGSVSLDEADEASTDADSTPTLRVQIGATWREGDDRLALLADLGNVVALDLERAPISDAALRHIVPLRELQILDLSYTGVTSQGLSLLKGLPNLRHLTLQHVKLGPGGLAVVAGFSQLTSLDLEGSDITDRELAHLRKLPLLQDLSLAKTGIADAGLADLKDCTTLNSLRLMGTKVSGAGLRELTGLSRLSHLSLKSCQLQPDALAAIATLEHLDFLGLENTNITDEQLAELANLKQLRVLWLHHTQLTNASVEHLKKIKSLEELYLSGTRITTSGKKALETALPNCRIGI